VKTIEEMVQILDGLRLVDGDPTTPIDAVTNDSRDVEPGALFVALRGARVDGHDFIDAAIEQGASAIVVDGNWEGSAPGIAVVEAADSRAMLGPICSWFYDHPSRQLELIGVTGTNGKTSTTYLLESIFDRAGYRTGVIGTIEYRWSDRRVDAPNTTPGGLVLHRTLRQMVDDGVQVVIVEVSSHGLELGRIDGTSFAAALFTNLSRDHIGFHQTFDAYRQAKWKLFDTCLPASYRGDERPVAVINADTRQGRVLADAVVGRNELRVATHCIDDPEEGPDGVDRQFRGRNLKGDIDGTSMNVEESTGQQYGVDVALPGRFNAENALGALAVARMLGVDTDDVAAGLRDATGIPGRMQRIASGQGDEPAVFVDYAHTPDALERALETLRSLTPGRLWVVFGCGGDRDRSKRGPMGKVAAGLADEVIVTSDNPRSERPESIIDDVVGGIHSAVGASTSDEFSWRVDVERRSAIEDAILRAACRDVILVAGKGHETYQQCRGTRRDFDDRQVAFDALCRRGE